MHHVQGHRNANVFKQTFDGSCILNERVQGDVLARFTSHCTADRRGTVSLTILLLQLTFVEGSAT